MENVDVNYYEDAKKLESFFSSDKELYHREFEEKGLILFCSSVLNFESFNIRDVDSSIDDLKSIAMVISNALSGDDKKQFNSIVLGGIERYYNWCHAVFNHTISIDYEDGLFNTSNDLQELVKVAGGKTLRDDYFDVVADWIGDKTSMFLDGILENCDYFAVDPIMKTDEGFMCVFVRDKPWTDYEKIWLGNPDMIQSTINARYRKAKDRRLVEIIKGFWERYGDKICYSIFDVEDGALKSSDSYSIDTKTPNDGCLFSIRKR